jgi:squalene-hopene/tetraprenyl-beta-curcumene cyclase
MSIAHWYSHPETSDADRKRIATSAEQGCQWLLDLQNSDGGWPTFCRGWSNLPFDRSGCDLTAHVIRALHVWQTHVDNRRIPRAIERGFRYLAKHQKADGSWLPLWFGNQDHPQEENPVYGTAKVLASYRDTGRLQSPEAQRGLHWLAEAQNTDSGWGGGIAAKPGQSSVEETALAVEALISGLPNDSLQPFVTNGLSLLIRAVEEGSFRQNSPIGFYFAKLWYHERLYPRTFTVSALGHALARWQFIDHSGANTAHLHA